MKINLSTLVLDLQGEAIADGDKFLTVRTVCCGALLTPDPKNPDQSADEKYKYFKLAMKITEDKIGPDDLSVEEVATLKKMIGKLYPPLVVGRCYDVLDPPPVAEAAE